MRRRTGTATALAAGLLLGACSSGEPEIVAPTPTPTPTAEPSPTAPEPVAVAHRVEAVQVNANDILSKKGGVTPSREGMDEVALAGIAEALVDLLSAHLDDLNGGGTGQLTDVAAAIVGADASVAGLLTTDLADEDNPAVAADLLLRIGVDEVPRWAAADLLVTRSDDTSTRVQLVFATDGELELVLAGREDVA